MPHRFARCAAALLAGTLALVSNAQTTLSPTDLEVRDRAVLDARAGHFESALSVLETLRSTYPENTELLTDQIVVLAWAERDEEALALAANLVPEDTPVYAALPIAKSARNLRRFDEAVLWYESAHANDPDNVEPLIGLLLTHADRGDIAGIDSTLGQLASAGFDGPVVALARGYAFRIAGRSFDALAAYDSVLTTDPANREALRGKALVLRSMLLPTQALEIAEQHPGVLTEAELAHLRSDEVAIRLRLASRTPLPAPDGLAAVDNALDLLDNYLARETDPGATLTLRLDRVVALSDANRAAEAVAAFEELPPEEARSHAYVLGAAARAYLQMQRPEDALDVLEAALELEPHNLELRFALVYTYLDLERFQDAFALSKQLTAELPVVNEGPNGVVLKVNPAGMRAQLLAGVVEAYGDQLKDAQQRFEQLVTEAPANPDARQELANIYRWRGWLDRSLAEYRQVLATDDTMLAARLGHAHAQIDAREYRQVEETVAEIASDYPREPAAERLTDRWQLHNRSELDVRGSESRSTGSTFGTESFTLDARWYTAPLGYRYRAFVHTHDATATFPEGTAERRRIGAGAQYRATRWTVAGEVSGAREGGSAGFAGGMDWRLSDTWSLSAGLELNSDDVQLRAHRLGIESDLARVSARYAASESFDAGIGVQQFRLSDGNRQQTLYADTRYRLLGKPRWKLDLTGNLSTATSDLQDVPYFSPERATALMIGLRHQFRLYRRYERSLNHQFDFAAGRYDQARFSGGSIWRLAYELRWTLNDRLTLGIGAERSGNFYDGVREHTTSALVTLNARF